MPAHRGLRGRRKRSHGAVLLNVLHLDGMVELPEALCKPDLILPPEVRLIGEDEQTVLQPDLRRGPLRDRSLRPGRCLVRKEACNSDCAFLVWWRTWAKQRSRPLSLWESLSQTSLTLPQTSGSSKSLFARETPRILAPKVHPGIGASMNRSGRAPHTCGDDCCCAD